MFDIFGPYEPWIGLVTAVGVLVALVAFALTRDAGDRGRNVVSAAGAVFLLFVTTEALNGVRTLVTGISAEGFDAEGGRRFTDLVLLLVGLVAGAVAVYVARSRAARPAYDDDLDTEDDGDEEDDGEEDDDGAAGWLASHDLLAVGLALALPTLNAARFGLGSTFVFGDRGDVTAAAALMQLLSGVFAGGALLAFVRRDVAGRALTAAFALVVAGAIVLPIWPETFVNEFWTSFSTGLAAGLLLAVALPVLAAAIPSDRTDALTGAVAVLVLLTVGGVVTGRVSHDQMEGSLERFQGQFGDDFDGDGIVGELPDGDFPADFPTEFPSFPSELLPTGFPAP